jgi:predicted metal-binding membrane protein
MAYQAARNHLGVVAAMLAAAAVAWWWTVQRMTGMDAGPGTDLGTLGWFTSSWAVMMAAMMLPSFVPTLATYIALTREGRTARWLPFAAGYLLVWAAAGVAAYGLFELGKSLLGGEFAWHSGGRFLAGGVLALAAAYQFTPMKRACLTRCRGQLGEVGGSRHGVSSALAIGARSGGWCLGCSWALMAGLFALGVMSLTWMALIAILVLLEKTSPRPFPARLANATVLAALAIGVLVVPHDVPGLVVPGSSGATHVMHSMKMMG